MQADTYRLSRRTRVCGELIANAFVLVLIGAWWFAANHLPASVMPSPQQVGRSLLGLFIDPALIVHTLASTARVIAAVLISLALGSGLALLARNVPVTEGAVDRLLVLLNSFPSLGWALLGVIWLGVSTPSVLFVEVAILTPFSLVNVREGLARLDNDALEMGRSFTRNPWRVFVKLIVPLLMPYLVAALRVSYGIGWKIALVAEIFGAETGLGYLMIQAEASADAARVVATCLAIVVLFTLGDRLAIEPLAKRFHPAAS
jgi:NitT/TauT family transport system permease protein